MIDRIKELEAKVEAAKATSTDEVEQFRLSFLSKKGSISQLFAEFKEMPGEQKRELGKPLNILSKKAEAKWKELKGNASAGTAPKTAPKEDLSMPAYNGELGTRHPLSVVWNEVVEIFARIGFDVSEGPEIEDNWHNFTALNVPENHPARDMQDTFFVETGERDIALRSHTSSVQVRVMENAQPPIRTLSPGRVYRNETISARAHCFFHQVEGLYVDKNVSFADLKQTLLYFAQEMFGKETQIRLRPSYFPFTEPSAEMDVSCQICKGDGCNVCKYTGYLEIMGCGMVDPNVLENCGIDSKEYSGFAFGMGIERIAMLKYNVNDLRLFSENDVRFLKQFKSAY